MTFHSILFEKPEQREGVDQLEEPAFFGDLNLDQVIASITAGRDEYKLKPFFYALPHDVGALSYRHEILHDLEQKALWECISAFALAMRSMREQLARASKLYYKYQKERWFLDAVGTYGEAVKGLQQGLDATEVKSRGFRALREYLSSYVQSPEFTSLLHERAELETDLGGVTYCLHVDGNRIRVSRYDGESNYATEVVDTFEKFKKGAAKDYLVASRAGPDMNHVEAGILDRVALLYPDIFQALDRYCDLYRGFRDPTIADFDREVQFYVAYWEYVHGFTRAGLKFCYPRVSDRTKEVSASETYDIALANKLVPQRSPVVCNDFYLKGHERVFVVTGPNQGGKTTFARTFGQLHYLASIGCLVPGSEAQLFLFDNMFAHFEREEDLSNLRGKLEDDLVRIHEILERATPNSIVIMNEIFTSTALRDAIFLGTKVLERIVELDMLCVYVTFVDELASLSRTIVSMVSTVSPEDLTQRTFKLVRKPADGRAYAVALAEKYGLTYEGLKERVAR